MCRRSTAKSSPQLARRIKNPTNNVSISVAVEAMRQAHANNYTSAVQFITARMAQINASSINAPGPNPRRISEGNVDNSGATHTEFNGVDIRNPFCTFTKRENTLLGQRGLAVVEELKEACHNNGGGGRGGRCRGRGGRNHRGYGRGSRSYYRYSRGGRSNNKNSGNDGRANANNGGGNRNVNEASTGGRAGSNEQSQQSSNSSVNSNAQSQASTSGERGGQNGARFGNNRP